MRPFLHLLCLFSFSLQHIEREEGGSKGDIGIGSD